MKTRIYTNARNIAKNDIMTEQITIPLFIFRDRRVAGLECMVEYLHDVKKLSFHEISVLFNRDDRTIWTVYSRAKKKRQK